MSDLGALVAGWPHPALLIDGDLRVLGSSAAGRVLLDRSGGRLPGTLVAALRDGASTAVVTWGGFDRPDGARYDVALGWTEGVCMVSMRPLVDSPLDDRARALIEAGAAMAAEPELSGVLQRMVDAARRICDAEYAAMGVLDPTATRLESFITSGLTEDARERIGAPPTGKGVLGHLIARPEPIRIADLRRHYSSVGVPAGHPRMTSFLGVPVRLKSRVFGNLYVTNKQGGREFTDDDLQLMETLGVQAAVAILNTQLRRARDGYVAYAAHELGNQLATIRLWTGILAGMAEAVAPSEAIEFIRDATTDSDRLLQDLMSLSRIEEGRLALAIMRIPVVPTLREVAGQMGMFGRSGQMGLVLAEVNDVFAEVDPARLRQILMNLLSNAVKYGGGSVRAGVRGRREEVEVWVSDSGPGIPPEDQERIFEPFVRLSREGTGSGIGLAVSRQLARLMGGDLSVESRPGEGARFTLLLPGAQA